MSMARQCGHCGTALAPGSNYCSNCGSTTTGVPFTPPMMAFQPVAKQRRPFRQVLLISLGACIFLCVAFTMIVTLASNGSAQAPAATTAPKATVIPPDKGEATAIDPRLLASDPMSYVGDNVYIQGRALNVTQQSGYTWVQILAAVPGKTSVTESVVVELRPRYTLLSDDCYRIYGIGAGTQSVTRTLTGASGEAPFLLGYLAEGCGVSP